jgi:PAS domain S-box-containing protein
MDLELSIDPGDVSSEGKPGRKGLSRARAALKISNLALAESLEAHAFLQSVLDASKDCIKVLTLDGAIVFMNDGGRQAMEVDDFEAIAGRSWTELWDGEGKQAAERALDIARQGGTDHFVGQSPTLKGNLKYWDVTVSHLPAAEGKPGHVLSVARDITIEKDAEAQRDLLSRELSHRIKNSLSLAQAIGLQTFRDSKASTQQDFSGRLAALATAQELLLQTRWTSVSVAALVSRTMAPLCPTGRCAVEGSNVQLDGRMGMALALAVHELATNALNFGALSVATGNVAIHWSAADGVFQFSWTETGGPPVKPPTARGFGTRLITGNLEGDFMGKVDLNYLPSGLVLTLEAPL